VLLALGRLAGARVVGGILIAIAVAVGGFFLRDITPGSVLELKVGDCFDLPTSAVEVVEEVQHHPCKESHTAELVGLVDYPSNDGAPYPSETSLDNYATSQCVAAFKAYAKRDAYTDTLLTVGWLIPTPDGWKDGDHGISCHLMRIDEGPMTQSYRVS
jgi:hypothetical protein